jgi:hypothetical protein
MPGDVQNRILHRELRTNRYREQWIPPGAGAKAVATRGSRFKRGGLFLIDGLLVI